MRRWGKQGGLGEKGKSSNGGLRPWEGGQGGKNSNSKENSGTKWGGARGTKFPKTGEGEV